MRLQKYLADCGVASRRHAEDMIREGRVSVNGKTITEMGTQVEDGDTVCVDGAAVHPEQQKVYILYHKPAGEMTTVTDPEGRRTVMDHFRDQPVRVYPVGRLDYDSEGLLLLTNDGPLADKMMRPASLIDKSYVARVEGHISPEELSQLRSGVMLDDRLTSPAKVRLVREEEDLSVVQLTIHEGRNRQVRRMLEAVGHPVRMLRRVQFGVLNLGDLRRGQWRYLTEEETDALQRSVREIRPKRNVRR